MAIIKSTKTPLTLPNGVVVEAHLTDDGFGKAGGKHDLYLRVPASKA